MLGIHASGIRGSIGGNTFTANQYHQIVIRQRTAPVQPQSDARALVKSAFSTAVAQWNLATAAQRSDWDQYAQTVERSGPLGKYQPSGRDLALGQYTATVFINSVGSLDLGMIPSMDAPATAGALAMSGLSIVPLGSTGTGFEVKAGNDNGEDVYFYGTRSLQVANSRNYWSGPFDPDTTQAELVSDASTGNLIFDNLAEDGVYFVKVNMISVSAKRRMAQRVILRAVASVTA
jgi:hypothetical protein